MASSARQQLQPYSELVRTLFPLLKNLLLFLAVWALKEAVTHLSFACPCLEGAGGRWASAQQSRTLYAFCYIVLPAAGLWVTALLLRPMTWRCLTGWRVQDKFRHPWRACVCFFSTLAAAAAAPLAWLFLVLLDGRFVECAFAEDRPPSCFRASERHAELYPRAVIDAEQLRFASQVLAYVITAVALIAYTTAVVLCRCCGSLTYYQWRHSRQVQKLEEKAFTQAAQEYYLEDLKANWKTVFSSGTETDWDFVSELPPHTPDTYSTRVHYTPLQEWNSDHAPHTGALWPEHCSSINPHTVTITVRAGQGAGAGHKPVIDVNTNHGDHFNNNKSHKLLPPIADSVVSDSNFEHSSPGQWQKRGNAAHKDRSADHQSDVAVSEAGTESAVQQKRKQKRKNRQKSRGNQVQDKY